MNFIEMWGTMGPIAKGIGVILVIMSMISFGVAIERIYTFTQARKQSKLYAPQVAKHLKEGRLKDAIAISSSKNYRYSHLAKVVLAGLQEYQFQQEAAAISAVRTSSTPSAAPSSAPRRSPRTT
jgi:biopolymer transport protein ExbB/biopolymer transport protein TolQ